MDSAAHKFPNLPGWTFDLTEVSAGAYRATATHKDGPSVSRAGSDVSKLIADTVADAQGLRWRKNA